MTLPDEDRDLFYRLLWHLLLYANQQLELLPQVTSPEALSKIDEETWRRLRDELYKHPDLFDSFVGANPFHFSDDDLAIVRSWKGFLRGEFFVWRYLRKYTVFLSDDSRAYGVVAPNKPFEMMLGPHLPVAVEAVLLPFRDRIVYDGLIASYSVSFGPGIRRMLSDSYRRAKKREGIVTSFAQLSRPPTAERADDVFELRYWYGFTRGLPYRLDTLKVVTHEQIRPDKRNEVIRNARKERILDLPARMGIEHGFEPIQVEVLELKMDGRSARIEVLNRGGSMLLTRNPTDVLRFHRFIHKLEETLPASKKPLL